MFERLSIRSRAFALLAALCLWSTAALATDTDGDGVTDEADVCCNTPLGIPVDADGRPVADLDEDCDVDLEDHALLAASFTGPMAPLPGNGTPCDDGDGCTTGDVYVCGVCVGGAVVCDDGLPCTLDACNPLGGACTHEPSPSTCAIGGACFFDGQNEPGNTCSVCDTGTSQTSWSDAADGSPCTDGDACTISDVCITGACVGAALDCDDGEACTVDSCVGGTCEHELSGCECVDATDCNDGVACTFDTCVAGLCFHDASGCDCAVDADCNDANACTIDTCDASLTCQYAPNDGAACDDGDVCTVSDMCIAGACAGVAMNCDDGIACTVDVCEFGTCINDPSGCGCQDATDCNDGIACTIDTCEFGLCFHDSSGCNCVVDADCTDNNDCTIDTCDASLTCQNVPTDGAVCDDGDVCTVSDLCIAGVCAGEPMNCDDGIACTVDSCVAGTCIIDPAGCECMSGAECNDGNACTIDTCDATFTCQFTPADGSACTDGNACTVGDTCSGGVCGGSPTVCDDGLDCTDDACDPPTGACAFTIFANTCVIDGSCQESGGQNPANSCEVCLPAESQTSWAAAAAGTACDDGDPATTGDTCDGNGNCIGMP